MSRIIDESGLLRDIGAFGSNLPYVKTSNQVIKAQPIQQLNNLYDNYNRITSYEQYAVRRYVLTTKDVTNFDNLNELFNVNEWLFDNLYHNLIFWYSALNGLHNKVLVQSSTTDFKSHTQARYLLLNSLPSGISTSENVGIVLNKAPNSQSVQSLILAPSNLIKSFSNKIIFGLSFAFLAQSSPITMRTSVPFCSMVPSTNAIDGLEFYIDVENLLVITYNETEFMIRLTDTQPNIVNSIVIVVSNIGSLMPFIQIYVNSNLLINEMLISSQKTQGITGEIRLQTQEQCGLQIFDVVALDFDTTESSSDYAQIRSLGCAKSLEYFFSNQSLFTFNRLQEVFTLKSLFFSCIQNFIYDINLKKVLLNNGSMWRSSWTTRENISSIGIVIQTDTIMPANVALETIINIGNVDIRLHTLPNRNVIWSIYVDNVLNNVFESTNVLNNFYLKSIRKSRTSQLEAYGNSSLDIFINSAHITRVNNSFSNGQYIFIGNSASSYSLILDSIYI